MNEPNTFVILAAAGQSTRFKTSNSGALQTSKVYLELNGRPVWQHSIQKFRQLNCIGRIYMIVSSDEYDVVSTSFADYLLSMDIRLVHGGADRWASVANGLDAIQQDNVGRLNGKMVAVHDAARPCFEIESVEKVIASAYEFGAAILAQPIWGTVKRVDSEQNILETVPRANLYQATTPQVSRCDWMIAAYAKDNIDRESARMAITDDAQLLAAAGYPVKVVPDSLTNLKITTAKDFALAESILR